MEEDQDAQVRSATKSNEKTHKIEGIGVPSGRSVEQQIEGPTCDERWDIPVQWKPGAGAKPVCINR